MSKYKGLFTFDVDNHRYVSVEQANGIISDMNYHPEPKEEPKGSALDLMILTLANFIENEPDEDKVDLEDCKQMLEKLKAWERLKDKGFRLNAVVDTFFCLDIFMWGEPYEAIKDDLNIVFGGEE